MSHDTQLLRRYAEEASQAAFAELVQKHIRLVYAVALRQLGGDRQLAEDATQRVFAVLARKATGLSSHPSLAGWLFKSSRFIALQLLRQESRRKKLEEHMRHGDIIGNSDSETIHEEALPLLDELVSRLTEKDRTAIVLRYFEGKTFAEVGTLLGLSEEGARSRIDRTVERLRRNLERRGIKSAAALVTGGFASQVMDAAIQPNLAATITRSVLAGAHSAGTASSIGILLAMNKTKIGIAAVLIAATTLSISQHLTNASLKRQLVAAIADRESLSRELVATRASRGRSVAASKVANASATAQPGQSPGGNEMGVQKWNDKAFQDLWLKGYRSMIRLRYLPLFEQLHLTTDQQSAFIAVCEKGQSAIFDIATAAQEQGLQAKDPALRAMRQQAMLEGQTEMKAVLGDDGYQQFQAFDRASEARDTVSSFVGKLAFTAEAISPAQSSALAAALAAGNDPAATDAQAGAILTPEQMSLFKELETSAAINSQLKQGTPSN